MEKKMETLGPLKRVDRGYIGVTPPGTSTWFEASLTISPPTWSISA